VASCSVFDAVVGSSALIIQKAQSELQLLDINGEEKETKTFEGWFISDIDVADIDSDGNKEIVLGLGQIGNRSKGAIVVYSFKKGIVWERPFSCPIKSLSCINNNQLGYIITAISHNGKCLWHYEASSSISAIHIVLHPGFEHSILIGSKDALHHQEVCY